MRWIVPTVAALTLLSTDAFAQSEGAPTGWTPILVVRAVPARPDGAHSSQVSGDRKLVKGAPAAVTIWSGRSLCVLGIGGDEATTQTGAASNVWKMTADYGGERDGAHLVHVTAGFTRLNGRDASAATTQTLLLREGGRVVLDALSEPLNADCQVHTVTLEAQLVMQAGDPALARARYAADLWMVHRDPDGREQREHLVVNVSADGPAMPFMFTPLTFAIPQLDPRQGASRAVIRLAGSLRVRPRSNGDVLVQLDTNRPVFDLENPEQAAAPSGAQLHMTLATKNDETLGVEFPPPSSGYASVALASAAGRVGVAAGSGGSQPTDAVQVKNNMLILYTFQFFKGHSTRLLITLKRLS